MSEGVDEAESVERQRTLAETVFGQREFGVTLAVLVLFVIGIVVRADVFLTLGNLVGVLRNAAVVTIVGYGMAMLITSGEFDLSIGSMLGIAAAITATMVLEGFGIVFTLLVVAVFALLFGITQGLLVTKLGLPSLIVTIGTLTLLRGGHLIILGNVTQSIPSGEQPLLLWAFGGTLQLPFPVLVPFTDIQLFTLPAITYSLPAVHDSPQTFNSFPLQIIWVLVLGVLFHYLLFETRFGYRSQSTGGDERAARFTGVKTDHIKIANFAIVALVAAFAGVGQLAFTGNVSPLTGDGQELIVIAAVVIGGTDLFGGEGTIAGTLLGALVFAFTQNILVLAGFGTQLFAVFTGVFIIVAVAVDALTRRARYEELWTMYLTPLGEIATGPRAFFRRVDDEIEGIEAPVAFLAITTVVWIVAAFPVVFFAGEFSLLIVDSGVGSFGTVPLFAFALIGLVALLSLVSIHAFVRALGGSGDIDTSVQVVLYGLAPGALFSLPFVLQGLRFIVPVVLVVTLPLAVAVLFLWFVGIRELHGLGTVRSAVPVVATLLLWALVAVYTAGQLAAAGG
jgi:ribose/xylose/arabinose/galactoside ABC-type transport system permease subunit